ncbi:MAG: hypothetical protein ACFFCS_15825 [Candidatus Hodarchaeota archaeon]
MPTFQITFKFDSDCSESCPNFPGGCDECLKKRMEQAGIPVRDFRSAIDYSEDQKLRSAWDIIYRKYLSVLNIKNILVLHKSGVCIYNHAVTGAEMDGNLIAGFIQANLSFSKEGVARGMQEDDEPDEDEELNFASLDESTLGLDFASAKDSTKNFSHQIYELNYLDFVLVVHEGLLIRSVLLLENAGSYELRTLLIQFTSLFEQIYGEAVAKFNGDISLYEDTHLVIEKVFETDLLYPYSTKMVSPGEENTLTDIEKIIYRYGLSYTQRKGFFFIAIILDELQNSLQKPAKEIIYAIYQLVEKKFFVPQDISVAAQYREDQENLQKKMDEQRSTFSAVYDMVGKDESDELKSKLEFMSEKEGKALVKKYMATASSSLEYGIYDDARKNMELAKIVAMELNQFKEVERINKKIHEVFNIVRTAEYENAMQIAVNAEKSKDYLKAIQNYNMCKQILLELFNYSPDDKRITQIEKRISNLQQKLEKL